MNIASLVVGGGRQGGSLCPRLRAGAGGAIVGLRAFLPFHWAGVLDWQVFPQVLVIQ